MPKPKVESGARGHHSRITHNDDTEAVNRALIVDDDPTHRLMMTEVLRQQGFAVAEAPNGEIARTVCREFRPSLILLDIDMPEIDGITACAALRQQVGRSLPIVMVTGLDDAESIHRAFSAGATDFITKPINWPLFHHRVRSILITARAAQDLAIGTKRIDLLERLAPDIALLVTRNGTIIDELGRQVVADLRDLEPKLDAIWPAEICIAMRQRISGTLKTRRKSTLTFELDVAGTVSRYEANFLPDGRDRVLMIVQPIAPSSRRDTESYRIAFYDPVTELPNLRLLERVANACLTAATLQERRLAVLCVAFNELNSIEADECSADMAATLKLNARAIQDALREIGDSVELDDTGARVARISRTHFAVLLKDIITRADVVTAANAIGARFAKNGGDDHRSFPVAPSIGISLFPENGRSFENLIGAAREAAEEARISDGHRFYSESAHLSTLAQLDVVNELKWAIEKGQLQLHYQPRIDLVTGEDIGVEALLRWYHPLRGIVPLDELLPLAEATGMMLPIGTWVLETACREIGRITTFPLRVSINLSAHEFADEELVARINTVLERSNLAPDRLELEVTETALRRPHDSRARLEQLKQIGVRVLLDHFGAGVSSLSELKRLPIAGLKVDPMFVQGSSAHAEDHAMCEVIITMAHKLGLIAIAEGVETTEELAQLQALGCDELQGFVVARPMPLGDLFRRLGINDT